MRIGRLPAAQQRAVIAQVPGENELANRFAAAARGLPLGGVPFLVKDLFPLEGRAMLAGSTFLPEVKPAAARDSTFVAALRATGAVMAGVTHMHEFAYGITGENPHYGDCEHPRFPGRTTGGSSSGSAAAVAAGIVPLALASDTGGSVRVPAAFCGLFGFRLSPHHPWIDDAFSLAPTFDTAGWFTAGAADMQVALHALIGAPDSKHAPRGCYLEMPGVVPEVASACRTAAERFTSPADAAVRDDLLTGFASSVDTYNTIVAQEAWQVHRAWAERYRERYDPAVWPRLNRVHSLTAEQIRAAEAGLASVRELWRKYFLTYDFLVLPATPLPALTKAECNFENRMRLLALTAPASLGGLPALTVPVPLTSGLTAGLQIVVNDPQSAAVRWALDRFR